MIIEIDKEVITMKQKVIVMVYGGHKYKVETITDNITHRVQTYVYRINKYTGKYEYIIHIEDDPISDEDLKHLLDIYNSRTIHMYQRSDLRA